MPIINAEISATNVYKLTFPVAEDSTEVTTIRLDNDKTYSIHYQKDGEDLNKIGTIRSVVMKAGILIPWSNYIVFDISTDNNSIAERIYFNQIDSIEEVLSSSDDEPWSDWTPTLTWETADPVDVSCIGKYKVIGKTLFHSIHIMASDGNGTTGLTYTCPESYVPKANLIYPLFAAAMAIDGVANVVPASLADNGENNTVDIAVGSILAGSSFAISLTGFFEIE